MVQRNTVERPPQNVGGNIEHTTTTACQPGDFRHADRHLRRAARASDDGHCSSSTSSISRTSSSTITGPTAAPRSTWACAGIATRAGPRSSRSSAIATARSASPAQTFPEHDFVTWNNLVPRLGITYDLTGDGKTVVKVSYGLFWHDPGRA